MKRVAEKNTTQGIDTMPVPIMLNLDNTILSDITDKLGVAYYNNDEHEKLICVINLLRLLGFI